jgi:hypothetical protein
VVQCPSGAGAALARAREVLEVVLELSLDEWPALEVWRRALPSWFVEACVEDAEVRDCVLDRWSLRAWVYWFQPSIRKWRWWDAAAVDGRLEVTLAVLERPYLRGALDWLLQVASRQGP